MPRHKDEEPAKTKRPWLIRNLETGNSAIATSEDSVDPKTGKVAKNFKIVKGTERRHGNSKN